jgi:hypothetical protein
MEQTQLVPSLYREFCTPDSQMSRSSILRTARKDDFEEYRQDEKARLSTVEFLPADDPEARAYTAGIVGCLFACVDLTNTRCLALLGDADADAYGSFSLSHLPKRKDNSWI